MPGGLDGSPGNCEYRMLHEVSRVEPVLSAGSPVPHERTACDCLPLQAAWKAGCTWPVQGDAALTVPSTQAEDK